MYNHFKQFLKKGFSFSFLLFILAVGSCQKDFSDEQNTFIDEDNASLLKDGFLSKNLDGLAFFPINQYTTPDKWKELNSFEEMKKAVNIDSLKLSLLDTRQLMKVCLEYPLLLSYSSHNDVVAGMNSICKSFIGFRILEARQDYHRILSDFINNYDREILTMSELGNRRFPDILFEAVNILYHGEQSLVQSSVSYSSCNSHSVKTPYGKEIYHLHASEVPPEIINQRNNYFIESYPNAIYVSSSTSSYNCHSYAWNMSEGGLTCWINRFNPTSSLTAQDNLSNYWTNDRYISVSPSSASVLKIYYPQSDHSAKYISASQYISKWGQGPLMKHSPGYGPYENMSNRQYYGVRQYLFTGDDFIYDNTPSQSHTYSVQGIPYWMNHTVLWIVTNGHGEEEGYTITTSGDSCSIRFLRGSMYEICCKVLYYNGFEEAEFNKEVYVENL